MNSPSDSRPATIAYYDDHAEEFIRDTFDVDMADLYRPFLECMPQGGRILDAGCGSGRDSLAFLRLGYEVVSVDASERMVEATRSVTWGDVRQMTFESVEFEDEFDGIWACASLLHVPRPDLGGVLVRLGRALNSKGILYLSFKHGNCERTEHGRFFHDLDEVALRLLFTGDPRLEIVNLWISEDVRNERRGNQQWINALARRRDLDAR
jgi:SAM-dependent methyltransferase